MISMNWSNSRKQTTKRIANKHSDSLEYNSYGTPIKHNFCYQIAGVLSPLHLLWRTFDTHIDHRWYIARWSVSSADNDSFVCSGEHFEYRSNTSIWQASFSNAFYWLKWKKNHETFIRLMCFHEIKVRNMVAVIQTIQHSTRLAILAVFVARGGVINDLKTNLQMTVAAQHL